MIFMLHFSVMTPQVTVTGNVSISSDNSNVDIALECRARGQPTPDVKWKSSATNVTSQAQFLAQTDGSSLSRLTWSIRLSQFPLPNTTCVGRRGSIDNRARSCPLPDYTCVASYLPINGGGMEVSQTSLTIELSKYYKPFVYNVIFLFCSVKMFCRSSMLH